MEKDTKQKNVKSRRGRLSLLRYHLVHEYENGRFVVFLEPTRVSELLGVSVKTVYKWLNGSQPIDPARSQLLHILGTGFLPWVRWKSWRVDERGKLVAPNGYSFWPDELTHFSYVKEAYAAAKLALTEKDIQIKELERRLALLTADRPKTGKVLSLVEYHARLGRGAGIKKPGM